MAFPCRVWSLESAAVNQETRVNSTLGIAVGESTLNRNQMVCQGWREQTQDLDTVIIMLIYNMSKQTKIKYKSMS